MVTTNSHESAGGGSSATVGTLGQSTVQVMVDCPIGNAVPDTGLQETTSAGVLGKLGKSQLTSTGKPSRDCLGEGAGQDSSSGLTLMKNEQVLASSS
jgi:hypothetical protein